LAQGNGTEVGIVVVVIGDIREFATESLQFSLGYVFVSFMLSGNLRNAIT